MGALKGLLMGGKTDLFINGGKGKPVGEVWLVGVGVSVLDDIWCCYEYKCKRSRITNVLKYAIIKSLNASNKLRQWKGAECINMCMCICMCMSGVCVVRMIQYWKSLTK
jgi:hypothetical protein